MLPVSEKTSFLRGVRSDARDGGWGRRTAAHKVHDHEILTGDWPSQLLYYSRCLGLSLSLLVACAHEGAFSSFEMPDDTSKEQVKRKVDVEIST